MFYTISTYTRGILCVSLQKISHVDGRYSIISNTLRFNLTSFQYPLYYFFIWDFCTLCLLLYFCIIYLENRLPNCTSEHIFRPIYLILHSRTIQMEPYTNPIYKFMLHILFSRPYFPIRFYWSYSFYYYTYKANVPTSF